MNEVVKYDNDLETLIFKGFTKVESDIFFALLYKLKNQQSKIIELSFAELKRLIDFNQNSEAVRANIVTLAEKLAKSVIKYDNKERETIQIFTLFSVLEIPKKGDLYLKAQINEPFLYLINNLKSNFTMWELAEYSNLSSKYTQTIYRLLKQFRSTGFFIMDWNEFREKLDIPKSYQTNNIEQRVLKPSIEELTERSLFFTEPLFKNLSYTKHKTKGKGNKITHISFKFDIESTENKTIKAKKQSNKEHDWQNQFYGKNVKDGDGITYTIYTIEKSSDNKIKAKTDFYTSELGLQEKVLIFNSTEQIKKAVEKYEQQNPKIYRPEVEKMINNIK